MLDAFRVAATGSRQTLERALLSSLPPKATLYRGLISQYQGDVEGAIRILRRLVTELQGVDRAAVADILAPLHVMRHETDAVLNLADAIDGGGWKASAHAFRALAYADNGNRDSARRHMIISRQALMNENDDLVRARVLQRLASTAFYLHEYENALDIALASANLSCALGASRTAAADYSIAYIIESGVHGNFGEAVRYASLLTRVTLESEDASLIHQARIAEYELAVQSADMTRVESLEDLITRRMLPQQYRERYAFALSYALVRGAKDLVAMRTLLITLRDAPGRSRGQWSLCSALIGISLAAEHDDPGATRNITDAIKTLGRQLAKDPVYEQYYRRLARSTVATAYVLLGNDALADRTMQANESLNGRGELQLPALMQSGLLHNAPIDVRGIANVFELAQTRRRAMMPPAGLTVAEFEVLRLLGKGWSAGRIALETQRNVQTIYNHTYAILGKLDASRASEAVAIARSRGLII